MPEDRAVAVHAGPALAEQAAPEDLMVQVAGGCEASFTDLYGRYAKDVSWTCLRTFRNPALAEDVAQEVWARIWQRASTWKPGGTASVRTWIIAIAKNLCIDKVRRARRRPETQEEREDGSSLLEFARARAASPLDAVLAKEMLAILRGFLTEQEYEIFMLWAQGETYEDLSAYFEMPVGTIKSRIHRMRDEVSLLSRRVTADLREKILRNGASHLLVLAERTDPVSGVTPPSVTRDQLLEAVEAAEYEENEEIEEYGE